MKQVIYMIGMMGAGKTTVGRTLAQRIGWDFIDMDREIEREQGKRISEIFSSEGEPAFRAMETDLLKRRPPENGDRDRRGRRAFT